VEKMMWKHIFIEFLGEIIGVDHEKFQDLNINKSYFANLMELEGISTSLIHYSYYANF
jgi:hypothetical protein